MKTWSVLSVAVVLSLGAGCSVTSAETSGEASASELRELAAEEILGEIAFGEQKQIEYTTSPKYRAYSFQGGKGDVIQAQVVSKDRTDPILWLTDENFTAIAMANDVSPVDNSAVIQQKVLPSAGKYFLVFREANLAPRAKFAVSLKKMGAWPVECDPDGEGIANPECVTPLGFDPFDAASCQGTELSQDDARAKFASTPVKPKIYYRTRQCAAVGEVPECSPWVRAFATDTQLASVAAVSPAVPNLWSALPAAGRKTNVAFRVGPSAIERFCVDGPFSDLRGTGWELLDDGSAAPPACTTTASAKVTASCLRIEAAPMLLNSGTPTYWTEFTAVLSARY